MIAGVPEIYTEYAEDVVAGKIIACHYIIMACQRYLDWFKREDIEFRVSEVAKVERLMGKFSLYDGDYAGQKFHCLPWQRWILCNLYGWYYTNTNKRVIKDTYLELSRKNGKSCFAALLSIVSFLSEQGAQVLFVANNFKQSQIAFDMSQKFLRTVDAKGALFKYTRDTVKLRERNASLICLANNEKSNDGWSPLCYVVDEFHAAESTKMLDLMRSGQGFWGNKRQGIIITTAGLSKFVPCYEMREQYISVLRGEKADDSLFAAIYTLDSIEEINDPNMWLKANPSLGENLSYDYLSDLVRKANTYPSELNNILTKNFNIWVDGQTNAWIPDEIIQRSSRKIDLEEFRGLNGSIGLDLASVQDLTALSVVIPVDGKYYCKVWYFIPHDTVLISPNRQLYERWIRDGYLYETGENATDYEYVRKLINDLYFHSPCYIDCVYYDPWNSTQLIQRLVEDGINCQPYSQSIGSYSKPTKEVERQILLGNVVLDANPVTQWCFHNVNLYEDINGNVKPRKDPAAREKKIDGTIALITAVGGILENPYYSATIVS